MGVTDRGLDGTGVASSEQHDRTPSAAVPGHHDGRVVVYAMTDGRAPDDASWFAIERLARVAHLVVVVGGDADDASLRGEPSHERVLRLPSTESVSAAYRAGVEVARRRVPGVREVVLTGDSWFGPLGDLVPLLDRMRDVDADFWHMVAPAPHREGFPDEGFPVVDERAWMWLAVGRRILDSDHWERWWAGDDGASGRERDFAGYFERRGMRGAVAVIPVDATEPDPLLFSPEALVESGLPFVDRAVFSSFPPFLERKAVIGREVAATLADRGYPADILWSSLARTVAPKALNTNGGMLEVLSGCPYDGTVNPARVVVVVHVSDMDAVPDLLARIERLPVAAHVVATVTEGISATRLQRVLEAWTIRNLHEFEVRVTPASDGRDMADFFAGCRDLLAPGRFDLVVKLHARRAAHRSMNQQRYFRRYQLDNLLESEGYVSRVFELFATQPRLGVVFPPMMHVGYRTMGRGWAGLRPHAEQLSRDLGISVPLDVVSPLAPYGGMFIARPEALVGLTSRRWTFSDYGRRRQRRFGHLAHLQERMIPLAAGESGFFCRTVMTFEHAEIAHTALDFKADQISATTRGWPVEKIRFLHRAGYTGYGGTIALVRMYVRVNHPRLAAAVRPGYRLALAAYRLFTPMRETVRRALAERASRDDGSRG